MKETLKNVIVGLLTGVYQSFWFVLLFAVVFMFAYKHHSGIKDAVQKWLLWFKTEKKFRRVFFLTLYTAFILFRTLFNRTLFENPLSNVMGEWSLFSDRSGKRVFNSNVPENFLMLMPFMVLLFLSFRERLLKSGVSFLRVLWKSFFISFLFSSSIEMLQLLLHLGTWQLSDLVYNTLGGTCGGVFYYLGYTFVQKHRARKKRKQERTAFFEMTGDNRQNCQDNKNPRGQEEKEDDKKGIPKGH